MDGPCRLCLQAQRLLAQRRPHRPSFESFIWAFIILCAPLSVVLSSISICDDHWLLADNCLFRLWRFCTASNQTGLHCLQDLSQAHVPRLASGVAVAHSVATLAVGVVILVLELLMVSQVCEDPHSWREWALGSTLFLVSFIFSFRGLLSFLILLRNQVMLIGLPLMFWGKFAAPFLFSLNAVNAITHFNSITHPWGLPTKF